MFRYKVKKGKNLILGGVTHEGGSIVNLSESRALRVVTSLVREETETGQPWVPKKFGKMEKAKKEKDAK